MFTLYQITNKLNNRKYIGYTKKSLQTRMQEHLNLSRNGKGYFLHSSIKKYGEENFTIEAIKQSEDLDFILQEEIKYIKEQGYYNIHVGGIGGDNITNHPNNLEIRKKLSEIHLKNTARGKESPRYIYVEDKIINDFIKEYYSFEVPSSNFLLEKYKISRDVMNRFFKETGNKLFKSRIKRFLHNPENLSMLHYYYCIEKKTVQEISKLTTLHLGSICKIIKKYLQVLSNTTRTGNKLHQHHSKSKIWEYLDTDNTIQKIIQDYYSFSVPAIKYMLKHYNIQKRGHLTKLLTDNGHKVYRSRISRFLHNEENLKRLTNLYFNEKRTLKYISTFTSLNVDTLSYILKKYSYKLKQ